MTPTEKRLLIEVALITANLGTGYAARIEPLLEADHAAEVEATERADPDPERLRLAVTEAESVFRHYGDLHAAKPDHDKAKRNYDMADRMRAALKPFRSSTPN